MVEDIEFYSLFGIFVVKNGNREVGVLKGGGMWIFVFSDFYLFVLGG